MAITYARYYMETPGLPEAGPGEVACPRLKGVIATGRCVQDQVTVGCACAVMAAEAHPVDRSTRKVKDRGRCECGNALGRVNRPRATGRCRSCYDALRRGSP